MGNFGLLLIRLTFGLYAAYYGFPKLFYGPGGWESLGWSLAPLGITFFPVVWGFLLAAIEFFCGVFFALGIFFRGSACLLFFRALLYLVIAFIGGQGLDGLFPWLMLCAVYLGVYLTGEGHYALARWIR